MPEQVLIYNLSHQNGPPIQAKYCSSFLCRLRGLTFRRALTTGDGLLLVQKRDSRLDSSIHMLFVWMDLAVVWINNAQLVVDVQMARSWRPAYLPARPARYVLEISSEHMDDFCIGDQVRFETARSV